MHIKWNRHSIKINVEIFGGSTILKQNKNDIFIYHYRMYYCHRRSRCSRRRRCRCCRFAQKCQRA